VSETSLRNAVKDYLSVQSLKAKWDRDQQIGSGYFYALTYNSILSFFKEHLRLSDALDLKVALIFSWNPTICQVSQARYEKAMSELEALDAIRDEVSDKNILNLDIGTVTPKLWYVVKKATSNRDDTPGVSVTKFLHFSFPHLFPMIDLNTMDALSGKTVNLKSYSDFLTDWKSLYRQSKPVFDEISDAVGMPITRVLDVMLFTPR